MELGCVYMLPSSIVGFTSAVMWHNYNLDMSLSDYGNQLAHVIIEANCICSFFGTLIILAAFAHEIIVRVDYK